MAFVPLVCSILEDRRILVEHQHKLLPELKKDRILNSFYGYAGILTVILITVY